jgi:chaperonin cofactor prefoldin
MSTQIKNVYSTKEYVDLYINNSKDKFNILHKETENKINMQNMLINTASILMFTAFGGLYIHTNEKFKEAKEQVDKRFEQVDKRFEQVDKRFEHIESEIKEIKQILIEGFTKK